MIYALVPIVPGAPIALDVIGYVLGKALMGTDMIQAPILVVDDEPAFGDIVKALGARAGVEVHTAPDAPAAFHAVREQRFSLILMDIEMAGITGLRGVVLIRQTSDWTRRVPIIAFSAHHPPGGERFFLERDFDGWLPKPFSATDLFRALGRFVPINAPEESSGQLSTFMDREQIDALMGRLRAALEKAIRDIDAGADPRPYGHNIGGLSGMIGFKSLSSAWLALMEGGKKVWPTVRKLTMEWLSRAG